ncbi:MAG: UbiA-like polyprenyltransferase [Bacteroidota bacterium]
MPQVTLKNYLSLVKFSHTIFAMPFAVVGFLIALKTNHAPLEWSLFVKVLLCMLFARNSAMAFNRWADREFDKRNPRTFVREIPSGVISANAALFFVIGNCLLFVATTYFINPICFYLSPIALVVVLGYSLTKRFTPLCHIILGLGLSLAPIGAYLAVTGVFDMLPLYFSFAVLFWSSGFDIIYALQDEEFDRSQKLLSIPVVMGTRNAMRLSNLLHFLTGVFLIIPGIVGDFGLYYFIGSGIFCCLLFYQHTLVKHNDLTKVNLAFFTLNGIASVIFALFFILEFYFGNK